MLRERLNIAVRYVSTVTPRCLMFMLSGPVELFLAWLQVRSVLFWFVWMLTLACWWICLWSCTYLRCVVCLTWFVNCLLKRSSFCLSILLLFCYRKWWWCLAFVEVFWVLGRLMFSKVCVFVLWSQLSVMCCFQSACLWFCIFFFFFFFSAKSGPLVFFFFSCCVAMFYHVSYVFWQ